MAVKVFWTEYERGWGSRPDGVTLHKDEATARQFIKDYWARQPDRDASGRAPDEYSAPSEPEPHAPTPEQAERLERDGSFWASVNSWTIDEDCP